jgi:hypothetical protein
MQNTVLQEIEVLPSIASKGQKTLGKLDMVNTTSANFACRVFFYWNTEILCHVYFIRIQQKQVD